MSSARTTSRDSRATIDLSEPAIGVDDSRAELGLHTAGVEHRVGLVRRQHAKVVGNLVVPGL
jgi:hypothetical protein